MECIDLVLSFLCGHRRHRLRTPFLFPDVDVEQIKQTDVSRSHDWYYYCSTYENRMHRRLSNNLVIRHLPFKTLHSPPQITSVPPFRTRANTPRWQTSVPPPAAVPRSREKQGGTKEQREMALPSRGRIICTFASSNAQDT